MESNRSQRFHLVRHRGRHHAGTVGREREGARTNPILELTRLDDNSGPHVWLRGILARAQKKRDYYYRSVNGRRLFRLDLGAVGLAFAGMSSPDDQKALDRIVRETAVSGDVAEKILRHRGLGWAAELVAEARANGRTAVSAIGHSAAVPEGA